MKQQGVLHRSQTMRQQGVLHRSKTFRQQGVLHRSQTRPLDSKAFSTDRIPVDWQSHLNRRDHRELRHLLQIRTLSTGRPKSLKETIKQQGIIHRADPCLGRHESPAETIKALSTEQIQVDTTRCQHKQGRMNNKPRPTQGSPLLQNTSKTWTKRHSPCSRAWVL